jgi:hypothetical protein
MRVFGNQYDELKFSIGVVQERQYVSVAVRSARRKCVFQLMKQCPSLNQIVEEGKDEIYVEVEKESYDRRMVPTELVVRPIRELEGDIVAIRRISNLSRRRPASS